jgi:hypothetical protein
MKTIVDCERNPKQAFFAYRDALTPLMINIRTDRFTYFAGETAQADIFICNDTHENADGHKTVCELIDENGKLLLRAENSAVFGENSVFVQGEAVFTLPKVSKRTVFTLRAVLTDKDGKALHYCDREITAFPHEKEAEPTVYIASGEDFAQRKDEYVSLAKDGATVVAEALGEGVYDINGTSVKVKPCGMRALHFVSRDTGHVLTQGFMPYDFRYWYDEAEDMITPILRFTFTAEGAIPILTSGNSLRGSAWGQKLYKALACAEIPVGKGRIIINQVDLKNHMANPVARIFSNRLYTYKK